MCHAAAMRSFVHETIFEMPCPPFARDEALVRAEMAADGLGVRVREVVESVEGPAGWMDCDLAMAENCGVIVHRVAFTVKGEW